MHIFERRRILHKHMCSKQHNQSTEKSCRTLTNNYRPLIMLCSHLPCRASIACACCTRVLPAVTVPPGRSPHGNDVASEGGARAAAISWRIQKPIRTEAHHLVQDALQGCPHTPVCVTSQGGKGRTDDSAPLTCTPESTVEMLGSMEAQEKGISSS